MRNDQNYQNKDRVEMEEQDQAQETPITQEAGTIKRLSGSTRRKIRSGQVITEIHHVVKELVEYAI